MTLAGVNSFGFDTQDSDGDTCRGPSAVAGAARVDMYYNWIATRVDLDFVLEPSTEPSSEPSGEPGAEPIGESDGWQPPFGAGDYDLDSEEQSLKLAGCAQASSASSVWLPLSLSMLIMWRRRR